MNLGELKVISIDSNRNRSMEQFNREDESLVAGPAHQDSFHTVHRSPANSNSFPCRQEWMHSERNLFPNRLLQIFDLFVRNGRPNALTPHETIHAGRPQDF